MGGGQSTCDSQGELHNDLRGLPSNFLEELDTSERLTLNKIYHCRNVSGHHFIIVELFDGKHCYNIRAEKFGHPTPGTYFKWVNWDESPLHSTAARKRCQGFTVFDCNRSARCTYGGPKVKLSQVEAILMRLTPAYNYVCQNCQHFARDAAKKLIQDLVPDSNKNKRQLLWQIS